MMNPFFKHIGRSVAGGSLAALTLLLSGCGDFLEATSQDQDYVRSWQDMNELLVGSCYMPVKPSEQYEYVGAVNYGTFLHLVGDEVHEVNTQGTTAAYEPHYYIFGYYTWQQRSGQNETYTDAYAENTEWTKVYNAINVANNILAKAEKLPQTTEDERQGYLKVTGEAYFLRAFYYFWLVNIYGQPYRPSTAATDLGVTLKTTPEVENRIFGRNTVQETYDQVLADLQEADTRLSQYTAPKKSIYRADSVAVHLLRSRVYLYMQDWDKAAEYARKAIAEHPTLMNLNGNSAAFMTKTNPENIFSMGGDDVPCLLLSGALGLTVSDDQYNTYSANDQRRAQWFWNLGTFHGLTKRAVGNKNTDLDITDKEYYYKAYYAGLKDDKSPVSSLFWLRSSEAYLNLAEAEACLGHSAEARAALLQQMAARYKAGAPELSLDGVSDADLVALVRKERRREFVLEGQRWFDLRRYRVCSVQPSCIAITHDYTYYKNHTSQEPTETRRFVLTEDDASWTLPMPTEVLEFNVGMPGNGNQWRTYTTVKVY